MSRFSYASKNSSSFARRHANCNLPHATGIVFRYQLARVRIRVQVKTSSSSAHRCLEVISNTTGISDVLALPTHNTEHSVIETIKFSLTFVSRVSFRIRQTPLCLVAVSETINVRRNENDIKRGWYSLGTADPAARVCVIIVRQWETNFRFSSA